MIRRVGRAAALAVALALAGCGGAPPRDAAAPTPLQTLDRSARLAFEQEQYAQAATLYEAMLREALAADAVNDIVDARFNLALCQTYLGAYPSALAQVALAENERARRGLPADPELRLLAGTIHYRAGDLDLAQADLAGVLETNAAATTQARAHFVAGLVAADRAEVSALRQHLAALAVATEGRSNADLLELRGRLLGIEGDVDGAMALLDQAVELRALERDYRGMARGLAAAAELAERAGRRDIAAGYWFRAGRSAAQRDEPNAGTWLERAKTLGEQGADPALVEEAEALLKAMDPDD